MLYSEYIFNLLHKKAKKKQNNFQIMDYDETRSTCLSQSSSKNAKKDWRLLKTFTNVEQYSSFIRNQLPQNAGRTSHSITYCKLDILNKHFTNTEKRTSQAT